MKIILILLVIGSGIVSPQKKDPDKIIEEVKNRFNKVEDYIVDVNIKVDVDFIKVPETNAKIYYKQPGKIHFESEGFAMLPKNGMDFSPVALLEEEYTAIYERVDTIDNFRTDIIKIIPLTESSDVVLTTLWVDESRYIIRKVESTQKVGGTFSLELKYKNKFDYSLPSQMIFTFNIEGMNLPKGMTGELNKKSKEDRKPEKTTGKVSISYKNYKINQGIDDSIFKEEE